MIAAVTILTINEYSLGWKIVSMDTEDNKEALSLEWIILSHSPWNHQFIPIFH